MERQLFIVKQEIDKYDRSQKYINENNNCRDIIDIINKIKNFINLQISVNGGMNDNVIKYITMLHKYVIERNVNGKLNEII